MYTINNWTLRIKEKDIRELFYQENLKKVIYSAWGIAIVRAIVNTIFYALNWHILNTNPSTMILSFI